MVLVISPDQETAVKLLMAQASVSVGSTPGSRFARIVRRWTDHSRSRRDRAVTSGTRAGNRWRDSAGFERPGWRTRGAYLVGSDEPAFEIDYDVCPKCGIGWVEQPYTPPPYQRRGLASAGLAALRRDHPEAVAWHTLGGHLGDSRRLWDTAGASVPGGYRQRDLCQHVQP